MNKCVFFTAKECPEKEFFDYNTISLQGRAFMINAPTLGLNIYGCRNEFGMTARD